MRWDYVLVEIYCLDEDCERPLIDHLEHRRGGWCEGDLRGFVYYVVGLRSFLGHYLAELASVIHSKLRWYLWGKWTFDDEAFLSWVKEHTVEESEEEIERLRCKFPNGN